MLLMSSWTAFISVSATVVVAQRLRSVYYVSAKQELGQEVKTRSMCANLIWGGSSKRISFKV